MERYRRRRPFLSICIPAILATVFLAADPPKKDTAKKLPPTGDPPRDEVAALVNGERIMLSELLARLAELEIPPEQREEMAPHVLDGLIDNAVLVQFLAGQKLGYDKKSVDAEIDAMRKEVEKEGGKFVESLAHYGMTEQKLRANLIAQSQWQTYLKQKLSDKELADYLAKHREFFDASEVRASHILVEVADAADKATRDTAKAKAERIRKEIAGGLGFAAAAKKYSDCPSKEMGGDVDWFPRRGKMVEPFAKAAFAMKPGELSGVVETEFGYHVIKVTERRPGRNVKIDDATVRAEVTEAVGEQLKDSIVAQQRKTAKIEIAPDVPVPPSTPIKTASPPTPNKVKK